MFRACEEGPAWHFSLPWSDTSGHFGGPKSALTGAYTLPLFAAAGFILHYGYHSVSANRLTSFRLLWVLARAIDQRPPATHCNLSTSARVGAAAAPTARDPTRHEADRARSTLIDLTSCLLSLSRTSFLLVPHLVLLKHISDCTLCFGSPLPLLPPPGNIMPP